MRHFTIVQVQTLPGVSKIFRRERRRRGRHSPCSGLWTGNQRWVHWTTVGQGEDLGHFSPTSCAPFASRCFCVCSSGLSTQAVPSHHGHHEHHKQHLTVNINTNVGATCQISLLRRLGAARALVPRHACRRRAHGEHGRGGQRREPALPPGSTPPRRGRRCRGE